MRIWPAPIDVRSPAGAQWVVRVRRPGDRKLRWRRLGTPDGAWSGFDGGGGGGGDSIHGLLVLLLILLAAMMLVLIAWYILIPLLLLLGELLIVVIIGAFAVVAARVVRLPLVVEAVGPEGRRIRLAARGLRDAERKAVELSERIRLDASLPEAATAG